MKANKNVSDMRPDITHQCLLALLDSPLNKAGKLIIFIQTHNNILIEVNPQLRVPRTFKRFAGLMVELLLKHKIKAKDGSAVLLKVIANPITQYLPPHGRKVGLSVNGKLISMSDYVNASVTEAQPQDEAGLTGASKRRRLLGNIALAANTAAGVVHETKVSEDGFYGPPTFVVGAVAHTDPASQLEWVNECIAISNYSLSAAHCCFKIATEFENLWGVF